MGRFTNVLRRVRRGTADSSRTQVPGMEALADVEFLIPNMVCEGCAEKLDGALHSIAGVREIRSDVRHKRVRVRYEPAKVDLKQLKDAVAGAGFRAVDAEAR